MRWTDRPTAEQERYGRALRKRGENQRDLADAMLDHLRGVEARGAASIYSGCRLPDFELLSTVRLASTSTDWPQALGDTFQRRLMDFDNAAPRPAVRVLTRAIDLRDFKPATLLRIGEFPELEEVTEGGEVREGTPPDGGEAIRLARFSKIFSLSGMAFQNDDVGAFNSMAEAAAEAVRFLESRVFFSRLLENGGAGPTLNDGTAFFDGSRGNLLSGAAIDATSLGAALAALRKMTAPGGSKLNLAGRYVLTGPDGEAAALQAVTALTPGATPTLEVVSDSHISDGAWFVFCDPDRRAGFVRGRLRNQGPPDVQADTWEVVGVRWKVSTSFAVGPLDPRAVVRNPGS